MKPPGIFDTNAPTCICTHCRHGGSCLDKLSGTCACFRCQRKSKVKDVVTPGNDYVEETDSEQLANDEDGDTIPKESWFKKKAKALLEENVPILRRELKKARKVVKLASDVSGFVKDMQERKSPISVAHAALKTVNTLIESDILPQYPEKIEPVSNWRTIDNGSYYYRVALQDVLSDFPRFIEQREYKDGKISLNVYDVYDTKFCFDLSASTKSAADSPGVNIYLTDDTFNKDRTKADVDKVTKQLNNGIAKLGRAIVEKHGPRIRISCQSDGSRGGGHLVLSRVDKTENLLASDQAIKLKTRIDKFLSHNITRSILMEGPPGTGKSCMARWLSENLSGVVLHISDVESMGMNSLGFILKAIRPNVVIVDDIDRFDGLEKLLSSMEVVSEYVNVFIASINNRSRLPSALIRPQRFDEIIEVSELSGAAVERFARYVPKQYHDRLKKWPISFIQELDKRIMVLGEDCVEEEFQIMQKRVDYNHNVDYS